MDAFRLSSRTLTRLWGGLCSGTQFYWFLLVTSLALHAFIAAAMGAKYWFDTIVYYQLADGGF